ncbi:MAG: ArdC family protein [Candidatus Thorarchaeota archaeon]
MYYANEITLEQLLTVAQSKVEPIEITPHNMTQIIADLEKKVTEKQHSMNFQNFMNLGSLFHRYSFRNTLLILWQYSNASFVAGYSKWLNYWYMQVQKGEKGIRIIAPTTYIKKDENGNQIVDANGDPVRGRWWKIVVVFDITQTKRRDWRVLSSRQFAVANGKDKEVTGLKEHEAKALQKEMKAKGITATRSFHKDTQSWTVAWHIPGRWDLLNQLLNPELDISDSEVALFLEKLLEYLKERQIPVVAAELGAADGDTDGDIIRYNVRLNVIKKFLTLLHEYAHFQLHWTRTYKEVDGKRVATKVKVEGYSREKKELQAESVVYVIAKYLGLLDRPEFGELIGDFLVSYIAGWQKQENIIDAMQNVHAIVSEVQTVILKDYQTDKLTVEDTVGQVKTIFPKF